MRVKIRMLVRDGATVDACVRTPSLGAAYVEVQITGANHALLNLDEAETSSEV